MSNYKPEYLSASKRARGRKSRWNLRNVRKLRTWIFAGAVIFVLTVVTLAYTYYSARAGLINISVVREMPKASILYDYKGAAFSRFFDENRIALPPDQPVPKLLSEAVVATEDRRFYQHGAIDPIGIARAMVVDVFHHGGREGASTITQQLARNSIGRMERTYDRKFLEIFFAHRIELAYSKDQILRYYLDRIYFGQGLYGAQTTAYAFFGVPASKLTLPQCALLAGMISSPNASSPWKDIAAAKAARDRALAKMIRAGYITQAEADAARKKPLALRPRPDFGGGFATSEVRRQLETILDPTMVQEGGLNRICKPSPRLPWPRASPKLSRRKARPIPMALVIPTPVCRMKTSWKARSSPWIPPRAPSARWWARVISPSASTIARCRRGARSARPSSR
jgi:penicillin-binding protein 1A